MLARLPRPLTAPLASDAIRVMERERYFEAPEKPVQSAWVNADEERRAMTLSWCLAFLLREVGQGSFERVGTILRLESKDDETVAGIMRALVSKWLDRFSAEHPASTVATAITELAVRLIDAYTKKQTELADQISAETKRLTEQRLAETERIDALTKELNEDAQRMREAHDRLKAAKTSQEHDDAFDGMVRALAGEKDTAVKEPIESYMKDARPDDK
jgi:hypothetical protein